MKLREREREREGKRRKERCGEHTVRIQQFGERTLLRLGFYKYELRSALLKRLLELTWSGHCHGYSKNVLMFITFYVFDFIITHLSLLMINCIVLRIAEQTRRMMDNRIFSVVQHTKDALVYCLEFIRTCLVRHKPWKRGKKLFYV